MTGRFFRCTPALPLKPPTSHGAAFLDGAEPEPGAGRGGRADHAGALRHLAEHHDHPRWRGGGGVSGNQRRGRLPAGAGVGARAFHSALDLGGSLYRRDHRPGQRATLAAAGASAPVHGQPRLACLDVATGIGEARSQDPAVYARGDAAPTRFTIAATTESGGAWLSATPLSGATAREGTAITAAIDPAALKPGIYRGTITVTPEASPFRASEPTLVAVALTVSASPFVDTVLACCHEFDSPGVAFHAYVVSPETITGAFTTAVLTDSGGNWLSVSPSSGTAPATLTVTVDPSNLAPGRYSGEVLITGSGNTIYMPVVFRVYGGVQLNAGTFLLQFYADSDKSPPPQMTAITTECFSGCPPSLPAAIPITVSVKTNAGGNRLSTVLRGGELTVSANSAGLAAGVYTGAVTLTSPAASGPTQVPVVLVVHSGPFPAITASPSALHIRVPADNFASSSDIVCARAGMADVPVSASASTAEGGDWLAVMPAGWFTQSCVRISINLAGLAPGAYTGKITLAAAGQSLSVPVKLGIDAPPPPFLGSVVNAASAAPGAVAPGEIVTLHGLALGPGLLPGEPPSTLEPPRVLFDGVPAQVLFASALQIKAVAPEELRGMSAVSVEVRYGSQSTAWTLPVAAAAPGIFTLDSSGHGPAAVLNEDNSVNSSSNPARRGSVVQIFTRGLTEGRQ